MATLLAWVVQPLLVVVVLGTGAGFSMQMASNPSGPTRDTENAPEYQPLVETIQTSTQDHRITLIGYGTLEAKHRVQLTPQIGGLLTETHPKLRAGGEFERGSLLLAIEQSDYQLAVQQAESEVSLRAKDLDVERAEGLAAREEWADLNPDAEVPPLVARDPQIASAEAALRAAEAQVDQAMLDLARTRVRAPFDGRVIASTVESGQVVSANAAVAEIYDTSVLEIPVPIRTDDLAWVALPQAGSEQGGSEATVFIDLGGTRQSVAGRVARLEGEIDPSTRLISVIVAVRTELIPERLRRLVLPGLYAEVHIHGPVLPEVTRLERSLVRDAGVVWLVENDRLVFATPEVLHADDRSFLVRGLPDRARLVVSSLEIVSQGMAVRRSDSQPADIGSVERVGSESTGAGEHGEASDE